MRTAEVNSFVLLLLLLFPAVVPEQLTAALPMNTRRLSIFPKAKVEIFNQLPNGAPLTIHCKSRDDNLGTHVLGTGQSFYFRFRGNFFGSTLFFCGASWQGGQLQFDIYDAERDNNNRCYMYCKWEARQDAIVGFKRDDPKNPDVIIPWNH